MKFQTIVKLSLLMMVSTSAIGAKLPDERGWFFFKDKNKAAKEQLIADPKAEKSEKKKVVKCHSSSEWRSSCGFVDPTKLGLSPEETYYFEQKQYHALKRNMALYPNDQKAVLEFKKFSNWAINQAMNAAYTSKFITVQNPSLDSSIQVPMSQFGNQVIKNIESNKKDEFYKMLSETSMLVYFTRHDCLVCKQQTAAVKMLEEKTGIPAWNASLTHHGESGFNKVILPPESIEPAQMLKVNVVPALFLYLGPNDGGVGEQWIRISTGITSEAEMENRIINFVQAFRHAIITGSEEGMKKVQPDFSRSGENNLVYADKAVGGGE